MEIVITILVERIEIGVSQSVTDSETRPIITALTDAMIFTNPHQIKINIVERKTFLKYKKLQDIPTDKDALNALILNNFTIIINEMLKGTNNEKYLNNYIISNIKYKGVKIDYIDGKDIFTINNNNLPFGNTN